MMDVDRGGSVKARHILFAYVGSQSAIGVWETQKVEVKTKTDAELLLVQVPMIQLA